MPSYPASSIVIPAYNESARIAATLREVVACIRSHGWDTEVIVVNDGSTDTTARQVLDFSISAPEVRLIENSSNLLQARGEIVMFTDADLSAPIAEAELLFDAIRSGADIAIGSRWVNRGMLNRSAQAHAQPLHRRLFGRCFNLVTRLGIGLKFHDTQCGFKAFTREAAQTVFQLQTIAGWGFDAEILFIAVKRNFRIKEVPVTWEHDGRSHLSYFRDGLQLLREMAIIRRNASMGRYNGPVQPIRRPVA